MKTEWCERPKCRQPATHRLIIDPEKGWILLCARHTGLADRIFRDVAITRLETGDNDNSGIKR